MVESSSSAIGDLREKIGALLSSLAETKEQNKERARETREDMRALGAELRNIKHEERQHGTALSNRVELLDLRIKAFEATLATVSLTLGDLKKSSDVTHVALEDLKTPVDELVTLRRRVFAYIAAVGTIIALVWMAIQPFYSFLVKQVQHAISP